MAVRRNRQRPNQREYYTQIELQSSVLEFVCLVFNDTSTQDPIGQFVPTAGG